MALNGVMVFPLLDKRLYEGYTNGASTNISSEPAKTCFFAFSHQNIKSTSGRRVIAFSVA